MQKLTKTKEEVQKIRKSAKISAIALKKVLSQIQPGIKFIDLDRIAEAEIKKLGGQSSFKTVEDYKWTICTTVNNQVVHGIPTEQTIREGDIVSIDIGAIYEGYHSDMAITVPVGEIPNSTARFLTVGRDTLNKAISYAKVGNRVGDISAAIQQSVENAGYSVVKSLTGHGIGKELHEEPMIPGFGRPHTGLQLKENMVVAIEVIYAVGSGEVKIERDGWTISTQDGSFGGLFEKTILVQKNGPVVLTTY